MAKRKIIWSRSAYLQRQEILKFWVKNNFSTTYSEKLLNETAISTRQLANSPYIGKPSDIPNIRVYVMGHYNLFYSFTENEIQVVCFWDNRQDPEILKVLLSTIS